MSERINDGLLLVNRYGYIEEAYFTWSYSLVHDGARVGGVFTAVAETTERVVGERHLRTLRELGARSAEARSAEQACRAAAEAFSLNPYDIPFALVYELDNQRAGARLIASSGLDEVSPAAPRAPRP